MAENYYNRTLLWSGSNASSINLSEPISNFECIEVNTEGYKRLIETSCNWNMMRYNVGKFWSNQGYMDVHYLIKAINSGKTLQAITYNFLMQEAKNAQCLLGSGVNRANNIKCFSEVYGINRVSGSAQTAVSVPPTGSGWTRYNETLLYSAGNNGATSITLSEPASAFERLRICVGASSEARNSWVVSSPSGDGDNTVVHSNWGVNTGVNAFSLSYYGWANGTQTCSSRGGKHFSPGWGNPNPWNGVGTAHATMKYVAAPIYAMYGINRKEV